MSTLDVVTFGEAMVLFMADEFGPLHKVEHFTRYLAGAETNVSIGLARLGFKAGWVSRVGADPFGEYILETLESEGVDTSAVTVYPGAPTGFQLKSRVESGDPTVQYFRKGSAASKLSFEQLDKDYFLSARHLHMTGIPPALSESARDFAEQVLELMKQAGRTISLDPNLRPNLWKNEQQMIQVINSLALHSDWLLPGIKEGALLTGYSEPEDIAKFYLDRGVKIVAVKLGAEGAYVRTMDGGFRAPGFPVKHVVDTVGAGDGFAVGMISGMLEGLPLFEAVMRANAIGAMAVMSPGDMDGLPKKESLDEFMQSHSQQAGQEDISNVYPISVGPAIH